MPKPKAKTKSPELPRWNLNDLYSGPKSRKLKADLEWAARQSRKFRKAFEGKLKSLDGLGLGKAISRYEKIAECIGKVMSYGHLIHATNLSDPVISAFFQTTTLIISIPSIIILTCLFISLWGGSIRFNTPMLFALAFLPMFGIGGLTGLPLGFNFSDVALHDSYYVIAHFHYVVAPGTIFAIFAGVYYWFPKMTGRRMNEFWGRVHFWGSLIFMNLIFMPMFAQGMAGMSRRMSDGGATYSLANPDNADITVGALGDTIMGLNVSISAAAWAMLVAQLPFIVNLFWSVKHGEKVKSDNPWQATTLEWETPTPPPHGNFTKEVKAYRDPYEYSVPGAKEDFTPQAQPAK